MIVGISLRQFKGFTGLAIGIDMRKERPGIAAIIAPTTEHHPSAIARPGVVALRLGRIDLVHRTHLASGKIQKIEVGLAMPYMEDAIMPEGEHQESSVGRHAWNGGALTETVSLEDQLAGTELVGIGIERFLIDIVFNLVEPADDLHVVTNSVAELEVGTAVIECLAIGSPDGEDFKLIDIVLEIGHLVLFHIIGYQVAHSIKDLDFIEVARMEALAGPVGGIGNQRKPRVPGRIDTS